MRHQLIFLTVKWLKLVHIYGNYRAIKTGVPLFGPLCICKNYAVKLCIVHTRSTFVRQAISYLCVSAKNLSSYSLADLIVLVNDEGSEMLVAVASAAGTWTDSAVHQPG